ncbi:MAG: hypothetical protein KDK12_05815 [Rhodobacteraceae bacterium]|nr:hypothetical protein [Paracoccaceae bacterium]
MALTREHDLHRRRWSRNLGMLLTLLAFVALVFGLTIAKIGGGDRMQGFDHTYRIEMDPDVRLPGANR